MIRRDGQSEFVDGLVIGKRGTILKVAGSIAGPGIPDGTGPLSGTGYCPYTQVMQEQQQEEEKQVDIKETPAADTKPEAENVLRKFDKSPEIPQEYIEEHVKRINEGEDVRTVMTDFFKGLQEAKTSKNKMSIRTAKLLRQNGIFKRATKDVYQDLDSGDFWKLSEDKKSIVRVVKENNEGMIEV